MTIQVLRRETMFRYLALLVPLLSLQSRAQDLGFEPGSQVFGSNSFIYASLDDPSLAPPVFKAPPSLPNAQLPEDPTTGIIFVQPYESLRCHDQPLGAYLFSESPMIVYVSSFVSDEEIRHLIQQRSVRTACLKPVYLQPLLTPL